MLDRDITAEEEANARRDADRQADDADGLGASAERVVDAVLSPLSPEQPDEADIEARREENDAEQRPT